MLTPFFLSDPPKPKRKKSLPKDHFIKVKQTTHEPFVRLYYVKIVLALFKVFGRPSSASLLGWAQLALGLGFSWRCALVF